ncbi:MAG: hypothetical protein FWD17_19665 [Polyangiaceae bacterium]|nr:hypothetical protein [Polyangiaceae bacterium]
MTGFARHTRALVALSAALAVACGRRHEPPATNPPQKPPADASAAAGDDDAVHSVYPAERAVPDPLVVRLCTALQETPLARLAECRQAPPGVRVTSECIRTLDAALHSGAVTLDRTEVDRCVEATDAVLQGCGWAAAGAPQPPSACEGLVHGTRTAGARCRSSLECTDGLRCHGVGPTSTGQCGPPHDEGGACGGSVDVLATYVRQNAYETKHRECLGRCSGRRCVNL